MPRKGYRAKTKRTKFPLDVQAQQKLITKAEGREKTLLMLMLSTGMHPKVLCERKYNFEWTEKYYSWNRPKTGNEVKGAWSRAMRDDGIIEGLSKLRLKTPQRLWQIINDLGDQTGINGLCPLQLRHTYFVNRARLGHDAFSIAHGAATNLSTVYHYYTIGMGESKLLTEDDRKFLEWLMEV